MDYKVQTPPKNKSKTTATVAAYDNSNYSAHKNEICYFWYISYISFHIYWIWDQQINMRQNANNPILFHGIYMYVITVIYKKQGEAT